MTGSAPTGVAGCRAFLLAGCKRDGWPVWCVFCTKEQVKLFLKSFYRSGEEKYPSKVLSYYASTVDRYFSISNASKEDILEDKVRFYKKWIQRTYVFKDLSIMDSYVSDGVRFYIVNTVVDWNLTSKKGKSASDTSYDIITLIKNDNGFLVKSIKSLGGDTVKTKAKIKESFNKKYSFLEGKSEERYKQGKNTKQKTISFNENGISIYLIYPSSVKAGRLFTIRAEMTNNNARAKQGGLTLSFPDMSSMRGRVLKNNFSLLKGYSTPDKIYNKDTRRNMRTKYYMVEGWQKKTWSHGKTKYFSVELTAPKNLNELYVNLRAVLWTRGKHDTREIPSRGLRYDQQGFAVKQFSIHIN